MIQLSICSMLATFRRNKFRYGTGIVVPELQEPAGTQGDSAIHLQHASYIQKE